MTEPSSHHWHLPDQKKLQQISNLLVESFSLNTLPAQASKHSLLDNFENTLWHSGILIYKTSDHFVLQTKAGLTQEIVSYKNPKFWWHFPQGKLQNLLKKHLGYWSLTSFAHIEIVKTILELRNKDEKTVVRLAETQHKLPGTEKVACYLSLLPLRGYKKEFSRALSTCNDLLDQHCPEPNLSYLTQQQGIEAKPKSSKKFNISADSPSEKAIYDMLFRIITSTQNYKTGIVKDIDTEFLHQYRVHLRQARSLVNLTRQALPEKVFLELKAKLVELASPTGLLRDYDVFLLNEEEYKALLPESFAKGTEELFNFFQSEREKAFKQVKGFLLSKKHDKLFSDITKLVSSEPSYTEEASKKPILRLAKKRILKRYQKVRLLGSLIEQDTPDKDVHNLRIECKKLRYLMEFFTELFPKKRISKLIKSLKELQSILGNFNDYSVQKAFIHSHTAHRKSRDLAAAVNGFIAVLHQKQMEEKSRVQNAFNVFGNDSVAAEFKLLFGS